MSVFSYTTTLIYHVHHKVNQPFQKLLLSKPSPYFFFPFRSKILEKNISAELSKIEKPLLLALFFHHLLLHFIFPPFEQKITASVGTSFATRRPHQGERTSLSLLCARREDVLQTVERTICRERERGRE